jgi:hypothetical protein
MSKRVGFAILGMLAVLISLVSSLNVLYNLPERGLSLDFDSGLAIALFTIFTLGSLLLAWWLFRRSAKRVNSQ